MAFEQVQSLDADVVISLGGDNKKTKKKNPTQVEGFFLGTRKVENKKSKSGQACLHFFQTQKGNLGVWGKTDLDRKLSTVQAGTMVRATWTGMKDTPNGPMYVYKVEQDKDRVIKVELAAFENNEVTSSDYSDEEPAEEYSSDDNSYDEPEADNDDSALAAAAAREERKARTQALLSGKGKKA